MLLAYPKETVVAEKLEALTKLGLLNSRMKDYYDLAFISRLYSFDGAVLVEAVRATFRHRETPIEIDPIGLTQTYYADSARSLQWRAFIRRSRFVEHQNDLEQLVGEVRRFAVPLLNAASERGSVSRWHPGGPWV